MQYDICFHTSNVADAGTDANVKIKLEGASGRTDWVRKPDLAGDELEQGMINGWEVSLPELGDLRKLTVESDGTGDQPGWHLAKVVIAETGTTRGKSWVFPFNAWFTKTDGLQKTASI